MPTRMRDLDIPAVTILMQRVGEAIEELTPDDAMFAVLVFDDGLEAQYVSSANREGMILALRECADRLERNETDERIVFDTPEDQR